jgi:hypothetical protein
LLLLLLDDAWELNVPLVDLGWVQEGVLWVQLLLQLLLYHIPVAWSAKQAIHHDHQVRGVARVLLLGCGCWRNGGGVSMGAECALQPAPWPNTGGCWVAAAGAAHAVPD